MAKTPSGKENLLLVEGVGDKSFFEVFCPENIRAITGVSPPKEVGGVYNSKEGALNCLEALLKQLNDGELKGLGLVVDADLRGSGQGFEKTLEKAVQKIQNFDVGYNVQYCRQFSRGNNPIITEFLVHIADFNRFQA